MAFCPVVTGTGLPEDEVVRTEEVAERGGSEGVHGTGFEIDEDGAGDILVSWSGQSNVSGGFHVIVEDPTTRGVVVDADPFELEVVVALVPEMRGSVKRVGRRGGRCCGVDSHTVPVDTVLVGHDFPELGT